MNELTNDAKYLLSKLYSEYLNRRKSDMTKEQSIQFDDVENIHEKYMIEWKIEDVNFTCFELLNNSYILGQPADDSIIFIRLSTKAISELEVTFKDRINEVLDYAAKIKNLIPFI